jgi:hypothetical protein
MKRFTGTLAYLFILGMIFLAGSCAPVRFVKPLEKHESAIGFNAGGPLIHFAGTILPVPFSSVYYGYGISEKGTISAGWHSTALLYENLQFDLAYTHQLFSRDQGPGMSITPGSQFILGLRESDFRFYPSVDISLFYEYARDRHMSYISLNNWFDPHPGKITAGSEYRLWRPSPGLGHLVRFDRWEVGLEYKYLGINLENTRTVVNYVNGLETGAHGIYLQFFRKF